MRIASIAAAILVLAGTIALAQSATYDFDRTANFPAFKTYAWVHGTELPDQFNHARVVSAVNAQLARKDLREVGPGVEPDLFVAYHAVFDRDLQITGFSNGFGPYGFGPNRTGVARTEEILTGTLVVDLIDSRTETIVWRAVASKEIDVKADPKKRERNINRAAERLFKNYPPTK